MKTASNISSAAIYFGGPDFEICGCEIERVAIGGVSVPFTHETTGRLLLHPTPEAPPIESGFWNIVVQAREG